MITAAPSLPSPSSARLAAVPVRRTLAPRPSRTEDRRTDEARLVRLAKGDPSLRATRDAQAALLEADKGLLVRLVRRYRGKGVDDEDLFQAACIGYLKGIERYDPSSGNVLATYALWWARREARACVIDEGPTINLPINLIGQVWKEQRAGAMSVKGRDLLVLLRLARLDAPMRFQSGDGSPTDTFGDLLPSTLPRADELVESKYDDARMRALIGRALEALPARDAQLMRRRHLAEEPESLEAIAESYGITRQRAQQIEARAFAQIHAHVARSSTAEDRAALGLDMRAAQRVSRFQGLDWRVGARPWRVTVYADGKRHHVGTFPAESEEQAARAYDAKARELLGDKAKLNFPEEGSADG